MAKIFVKLIELCYRRKWVFLFALALLLIFLGNGISKLNISEDIFSALPKGKEFEKLNRILENNNVSNQAIFSIQLDSTKEETDLTELAQNFADSLQIASNGLLGDIKASRPDVAQQTYSYLYQNFPYFLDSSYYSYIQSKIDSDSSRNTLLLASYNRLISPGSAFLKEYVLNDPYALSGEYFKTINENNNPQGIIVLDGLVFTGDKKKLLITGRTTYSAHNSGNNVRLHNQLNSFITRWNLDHPTYTADYFGTFEVAAENAIQVKKDTNLTLFITLFLILGILFIYYRKILIPFYFILPALFGAIFSAGLMGYVRPDISAISLATSAILLGIILDYSFHFFTHLRHTHSIEETIKDIAIPLLTGSFTTITALAALNFASSSILRDFGLFAAFSLSGAALFTLVALPVILKLLSFDYKNIPNTKLDIKIPTIPTKYRLLSFLFIIGLTIFFFFQSQHISFDADLENLSFHTQNLKDKEQEYAGINPDIEKKLYLFASDSSYEKAAEINFTIFEKVKALKATHKIKSFLSSGQFIIPQKIKNQRAAIWKNFWATNQTKVRHTLKLQGEKLGFKENTFSNFENLISSQPSNELSQDSLIKLIGIDNLIGKNLGKHTFITTIVLEETNIPFVKEELAKISNSDIFDRAETATLLLSTVKSDFNYILFISAGIVFFTLLLIYGRIELTLLAFFPMVVSWIWILGIASLFNIPFNFVNVVISTFIFGLGDDFSIFVTDGLLSKYKYRKDSLSSYTSAIILSATATIIGTGVLFFAKHPAIHSVAAISVLGIVCILFLSLIFQPILFDFFVLKRIDRKKAPVSIFEFVNSLFSLSYFVFGCFSFYPILVILILLPLPKKLKTKLLNRFISFFSWTIIHSGLHVRKFIRGKENLDIDQKPAIIIANHTSFLDIMLMLLLHPKIIIMVKGWVYNSVLFGFCVRYAGYIYSDTDPSENLEKVKERIADGYSLMIFPEGTRSEDGKLKRFHKGAFLLSKELNLDIIPIVINGAYEASPKGNFLIRKSDLDMDILPRIKANDISWGITYQERTKSITKYFKKAAADFATSRETQTQMWDKIFQNYIFKGPIIEWYGRIKWKLEFANYNYYNELIGNRQKVMDIGCGYGYLSLFLHFKNRERVITAFDYDEEKIEIASHVYDKTENLNFFAADIRTIHFEPQDVIMLNDILHYLSAEDQAKVLDKCYQALNPNGIILIRDGITDLNEKHKATQLSELFSTKIMGFNKKENEFHFFSSEDIRKFAQTNNLSITIQEHSKNMSNVLFILKKP